MSSLDEACRLFFTPPRARATAAEQRVIAEAMPLVVPFRGQDLTGYAWGEGPSVLLVHGWCGRASQLGAFVQPLVEAGLRVVAVDAPAHGESPGERSSLFEFADLVGFLAEREFISRAVIGHSMGAASAVMALGRGAAVERAVLISPIFRLRDRVTRFADRSGLGADAERALVREMEARYGARAWEDSSLDVIAGDLDVPALVVHDRQDAEIPFADGERTADSWRGARFLATSGLGHRSLLRDRTVIESVARFCIEGGGAWDRRKAVPGSPR